MWTFRSLLTTLHQRCLITGRRNLINLRALPIDKVFHRLKFPGSLMRQPKGTPSKIPSTSATLTTIPGGVRALDATAFSVGLGNTASVLSPKYEVFCRRSVGCFSRRERSAHIFVIRVERATRKNSQLAPAQRVAMKMGRLRCSSVTNRFRYAPSYRQSGSDRLAGGPF